MNNKTYSAGNITLRIWMSTALCLSIGMGVCEGIFNDYFFDDALFIIPFFVGTLVGSLPVLPPLWYSVEHIEKTVASTHKKLVYLCFSCLFITSLYGGLSILLARLFSPDEPVTDSLRFGWCVTGILFLASFLSILINYKSITGLFSSNELLLNELIQSNTTNMQQDNSSSENQNQTAVQPLPPKQDTPFSSTI